MRLLLKVASIVAIVNLTRDYDQQQRKCSPGNNQQSAEMEWIFPRNIHLVEASVLR